MIRVWASLFAVSVAACAISVATPQILQRWSTPCQSVPQYQTRTKIDEATMRLVGSNCYTIRREGNSVKIWIGYSEMNHDKGASVATEYEAAKIFWTTFPYRLQEVDVDPRLDLAETPAGKLELDAKALSARFGPRPTSLHVREDRPTTTGQTVHEAAQTVSLITSAIALLSGLLLGGTLIGRRRTAATTIR
jgi:hypothetical protein